MLEINIKLADWNWLSLSAMREHCSESCVQVLLKLIDTWTELRTTFMRSFVSFFFRCGITRRGSILYPPTSIISTTWSYGSTYPLMLWTGDNMVMLFFYAMSLTTFNITLFLKYCERCRIGKWRMMSSFLSDIECIKTHQVLGSPSFSH